MSASPPASLRAILLRFVRSSFLGGALLTFGVVLAVTMLTINRLHALSMRGVCEKLVRMARPSLALGDEFAVRQLLASWLDPENILGVTMTLPSGSVLDVQSEGGEAWKHEPPLRVGEVQLNVFAPVWLYRTGFVVVPDGPEASLAVIVNNRPIARAVATWLGLGLLAYALLLGGLYWRARRTSRRLVAPLRSLEEFLLAYPASSGLGSGDFLKLRDTKALYDKFTDLQRRIERQNRALADASILEAVGKVSAQVAHDIRSPLTALKACTQILTDAPEDIMVLLRTATDRITRIADDLSAAQHQDPTGRAHARELEALLLVLDRSVAEKRLEVGEPMASAVRTVWDASAPEAFARLERSQFARLVSNLLNNAFEALTSPKGRVTVSLRRRSRWIRLAFVDDGRGIPKELLPRLGRRGETHGKAGGSGLGLYHAMETVKSWGGRLRVASTEGRGTAVVVLLPPEPPPSWFLPAIEVPRNARFVIADDDARVRALWEKRAAHFDGEAPTLLAFSDLGAFLEWYQEGGARSATRLFLDHRFGHGQETGLDVLERLGLGSKGVLVTGSYDDPEIIARCLRSGVRLLPKPYLPVLPWIAVGEDV